MHRRKLTADLLIFIILMGIFANVSVGVVSISLKRDFIGIAYAQPAVPFQGAFVTASGDEGWGYALTDSQGHYSITSFLDTGNYNVTASALGYVDSQINNVGVTAGAETPDINFVLSVSGGISGRVTDAVSGLPLQSIIVVAYNDTESGEYGYSASTDADGNYQIITNLPTGTYRVTTWDPIGHLPMNVSGISVTAGLMTSNANFALDLSGTISGRVTSSMTGQPLANAMVIATYNGFSGSAFTDAAGYYQILSGLGGGSYTVFVYYEGSFGQTTGVVVVQGQETSNVNLAIPIPPSGTISGQVVDSTGGPIASATVTAQGPSGSGTDYTDSNGNYAISTGLGTGTYTVSATAMGFFSQSQSGVTVTVNQVTPNINFQLSPKPSGRISGLVQVQGVPIPEFRSTTYIIIFASASIAIVLIKLKMSKLKRAKQP